MTAATDTVLLTSGIAALIESDGPFALDGVKSLCPDVDPEVVSALVSQVSNHYFRASIWREDVRWALDHWTDERPEPGMWRQFGDGQAAEENEAR